MAKREKKDWAIRLLKGVEKVDRRAKKNEKAHCNYWNGDTWGSISGMRDADEWVLNQKASYVRRFMIKVKIEKK